MTSIFETAAPATLTVDELAERVVGYASQIAALTARFLDYLAEFDLRHGWSGHGILSCSHWLSWKAGLSLRTAQEHVRIARTLRELPLMRAAFAAGTLSYSKVRALTRVATAQREEELVRLSHSATASQVERMCAAMRTVDRNLASEEARRHAENADGDVAATDGAGEGAACEGAAGGDDAGGDDAGCAAAEDCAVSEPADAGPDHRADAVEPPAPESGARWRWNDDGTLTVSARLNAVDGAHFLAAIVRSEYERTRTSVDRALPTRRGSAIDASAEAAPRAGVLPCEDASGTGTRRQPDLWASVPCNIAPALVAMADALIDGITMPQFAPGAEILIHEVDGTATVDQGPQLGFAERAEAACGAAVRPVGHAPIQPTIGESPAVPNAADGGVQIGGTRLGAVLSWGRRRRVPTSALARVIAMRDRACRAPGCGRTRHLNIHHVVPWSAGGTTDPDNLILLCSQHHRQLHQGVFSITALGGQRFAFRGTHGEPLEEAPIPELPGDWAPWDHIPTCAVSPTAPGRLDLGYATEVLYAAWAWKRRRGTAPEAPGPDVAAA
ncbi:HNH endonuclease signature motif containing protein [Tsukamurella soli]